MSYIPDHVSSRISTAWKALGASLPSGLSGATLTGGDPVLTTPFRVANCGAAAIASAALAAARFGERRGLGAQTVRVDAPRAAAGLRSATYLRIDGDKPGGAWDKLSGFYPVRGGRHVSIHCNFPAHAQAASRVLGTEPERSAMEAASISWDGAALEGAIHRAGGCAGLVRTASEWRAHPQSTAVAKQPLLEIRRIGAAPVHRPSPAARPLEGIRVLDLTRVLAGPTCARALAEHGAEVLKITGPHLASSGSLERDTGLGKRAAHLDLRRETDRDTLRGLLRETDIFSQSYRPGTLAERGFSPEALATLRPGIICVSLSAWGTTGPWRDRRGFDSIVQCVSGMAQEQGGAGPPKLLPCSAIDYVSGYLMALGAIAALARRAEKGGSWLVRVGLARVGQWITDQSRVSAGSLLGLPVEFSAEELAGWTVETPSPAGRLHHLAPIAEMSLTPPYWARPSVPLGTDQPAWPAKETVSV